MTVNNSPAKIKNNFGRFNNLANKTLFYELIAYSE
jgi:hypothetical protein